LITLAFLAACTNATSTEEGGDPRYDAAPTPAPEGDGGNTTTDAGHAWSDLYRDYFGPTGAASCAGTSGQCHGDTSSLGYQASDYVCPGSASACYAGITSPQAGLVPVNDTTGDPTLTSLYATLRKEGGGGEMPKEPASFSFTPSDMKRITDWIQAGAPND
jgi:hypothetical protein